ncbi:hypothetical protein ONE63_008155 [Megalurothrips usitatus]|uniref:Uncharacterized protein n=1 Tax=Megalurothrips usitatus TaxID=439358 RepID=A0AAV7XQ17_9NEOP|nr:hypothetical protein ONE63_008155 [Megalurothrips usitatus]
MTSQSPDLFLEKASYVVMYLEDGIVAVYIDRDTRGKVLERSDLLTCSRSRHSEEEQAFVLGFGETAREATKSASSPLMKRRMTRSLARNSRATE